VPWPAYCGGHLQLFMEQSFCRSVIIAQKSPAVWLSVWGEDPMLVTLTL
jgi:hypothetical protein